MIVTCDKCGTEIEVINRTGRPRSNITVKNVLDALQVHKNVTSAAQYLKCTRGLVYLRIKEGGYDVKELVNEHG